MTDGRLTKIELFPLRLRPQPWSSDTEEASTAAPGPSQDTSVRMLPPAASCFESAGVVNGKALSRDKANLGHILCVHLLQKKPSSPSSVSTS